VTSSILSYDHYRADGCDEWLTVIGSPHAPPILFLPPLFEEMNRTRALIVAMMRSVAARGYGCWLPDLPGTGESEKPLETTGWEQWRGAVAAAAAQLGHGGPLFGVASVRGGCLLDDVVPARCAWRFAPVAGTSLARDLSRAGLTSGGGTAGYAPGELLLRPLERAEPAEIANLRTLRLESDRGDADRKIDGPPLWRRAEPESSSELAALLSEDLLDWLGRCADS
jgi:pimeloyl-ACP methyl ester carboxylesterase